MAQQLTTTLGELVNAEAALVKVLAVKFDKEGGAKVRYHLVKLAKLVGEETKHFYTERNSLIERYGEGTPKMISGASTNWTAFTAALRPVSELKVTLPWGPVTSSQVEPYPEITPGDLLGLGPLFDLDVASVD